MNQRKATRDSWRHRDLPEKVGSLPYERTFTENEFERLSFGLIPSEMEDKWFIVLEELSLFFHRSWTGICIYRVDISRAQDGYEVESVLCNRDPDEYSSTDDLYDAALLRFLVETIILGGNVPFPVHSEMSDHPKGALQHNFSGTGAPEEEYTKN